MINKIDHAIDILSKAKNDKKTMILVVGCVVSFGVAVGAVTVYERLVKELGVGNGHSYFNQGRSRYYEDYEEDEY